MAEERRHGFDIDGNLMLPKATRARTMLAGDGRGVPHYRIDELRTKRHDYCVAVFVIDEGEKLIHQLERMQPFAADVDILVADGGSTDGSTEISKLAPRSVRTLLTKTGPGKLSAQLRMAFDYALRDEYEGIVSIDGNNKDDPAAIRDFVAALKDGFDYLQGSRFLAGGRAIRTPLIRLLAIKLVHAPLIRHASGFPYTDTTNGFRGYSRRLLSDPRVAPLREVFTSYELHYYLAIRAARLGFRVREVPVTRAYPRQGRTPTKIRGLRGYRVVWRDLWQACRHRFDPVDSEEPA